MDFEWDLKKSRTNLLKHGISFEEASKIFLGPVLTAEDDRRDYGEKRFISVGVLGDSVVIVVAHTDRLGRLRIISARKANREERGLFYEYLKTKG